MIGACTAHCPPPDGTKTFTIPADKNVSIGKVSALAMFTNALGIAGLGARDIMGYCIITLIFVGLVVCGGFFLLT